MNSNLGKTINNISYASKMYDNIVKELFADKQVLANILKYSLDEFMDMSIPDIIAEMGEPSISNIQVDPGCTNTGSVDNQNGAVNSCTCKIQKTSEEDIVIGEGKIVYDIRFFMYHGDRKIKILKNIEAQNISKSGSLGYDLDNRIIYYLCRMISSQKEVEFTHSNYDDIKAVRSIWICLDGKENEDSINRIELTTKNIFGQKSNFNNINKLQAVIIKLREAQNVEVSKKRLIAMLEELVSKDDTETKKKKLSEQYDLVMDDKLERQVKDMCNFSEALIERGREEEKVRGLLENIKNMQKMDFTEEIIMQVLSIDNETYRNISNLINTYPNSTVDELVEECLKINLSGRIRNGYEDSEISAKE